MAAHESDVPERVLRLVYSSAATTPFADPELVELLAVARRNNERMGVTGMLLYAEGTFLQTLEGDAEVVLELYERIELDPRHGDVRILLREEGERAFGRWTMGFVHSTPEMFESIDGLNDFLTGGWTSASLDATTLADRTRKILEQFRAGQWRRSIA